jgi:hypothetical protein
MDDPLPQPIHSLITALDAAIARLGEATSLKQRKARNQVCVNRGLALHERLGELRVWLNEHDDEKHEEAFLANLAKYKAGWDADAKLGTQILDSLACGPVRNTDLARFLGERVGAPQLQKVLKALLETGQVALVAPGVYGVAT